MRAGRSRSSPPSPSSRRRSARRGSRSSRGIGHSTAAATCRIRRTHPGTCWERRWRARPRTIRSKTELRLQGGPGALVFAFVARSSGSPDCPKGNATGTLKMAKRAESEPPSYLFCLTPDPPFLTSGAVGCARVVVSPSAKPLFPRRCSPSRRVRRIEPQFCHRVGFARS
jgi:hypothetical protein